MARLSLAGGVFAAMTLLAAVGQARAEAPRCDLPLGYIRLDQSLPATAARLARRLPLTIVAFGSSSTAGVGASSPAANYPSQLERRLAERFPDIKLRVLNQGVAGENSAQMAARFDRDTVDLHPDLVVWQTGSNDILMGADIAAFRQVTQDGIRRLHRAGIDVLIMEPQYSPRLVARPNYAAYVEALQQVAQSEGAPLVHRFEAMEYWFDSGELDRHEMLAGDALHMSDASYACLGSLVAAEIALSVAPPARLAGATP
jgi:acyl-CoA thioesterase-1